MYVSSSYVSARTHECRRARQTATVILGASSPAQVTENLQALDILPKLTEQVLNQIEEIVGTKPNAEVRFFL